MKKILVFSVIILAMISCAKVTVDTSAIEAAKAIETPISFEAYNYVAQTKAATENQLRFYLGGTFNTFAFYSTTDFSDLDNELPESSKFIDEEGVAWRDPNIDVSSYAWRTSAMYYWPKVGKLSFFAYYPSAISSKVSLTKKDEGIKISNYSVLETVAAQNVSTRVRTGNVVDNTGKYPHETGYVTTTGIIDDLNDILIAEPVYDQTANKNGTYYTKGVPMLFQHQLAKVKLVAKQAKKPDAGVVPGTFRIIINDISIDNIHLSGSYSVVSPSTTSATTWTTSDDLVPATDTETAHKNSGNFVFGKTNDGKGDLNTETGKYLFDPQYALPLFYSTGATENSYKNLGDEYYVLPQDISNLSSLIVKYTVFALDDSGYIINSSNYTEKVQLNKITYSGGYIDTWKINSFYTYKLLISPYGEPVLFDPAIEDWSKVTSNPHVIYSE